jgi:hypothetical protein
MLILIALILHFNNARPPIVKGIYRLANYSLRSIKWPLKYFTPSLNFGGTERTPALLEDGASDLKKESRRKNLNLRPVGAATYIFCRKGQTGGR